MNRTIFFSLILFAIALLAPRVGAQGADPREEMKKRMDEIARLMRDSERGLLDISRLGRLLEEQAAIVEKLKQLEPPPATGAEAEPQEDPAESPEKAEREKQQQRLKEQQVVIAERLRKLFDDQRKSATRTVEEIERLLLSLPREEQQGDGDPSESGQKPKSGEEEKQRLPEPEEKAQKEPKDGPAQKEKEREPKPASGKKPESETDAAAQQRRINAWKARLPPEIQERLNRNDYSAIPARYQRLVREITALRAKREAEETPQR